MSRYWGKKILHLTLPLIGFLSYYMGIYNYCLLCQYPNVYQAACGGAVSMTKEDYENIRETQEEEGASLSYALWAKTDGMDVEDPQWGRRSSVCVWKVRGSLEILFSGSVNLQEQDLQGCYLDAGTARELFGSTEVIGSEILCGGKRFTIRGILGGETAVLVIRPGEKETTDHVALENTTALESRNFLMRYGISGTAADPMFLREILQILLFLFPVSLGICLSKDLKGSRVDSIRWILLLFMFCMLLRLIQIPETMIPDKWSNFQFWGDWWESAKDNVIAYMGQEKTGKELARTACFLKGAVCSVLPVFIWEMLFRMKVLSNMEVINNCK